MRGRSELLVCLGLTILAGVMAAAPAHGQTPKRRGILNAMLAEDPPGLSIHESATISGVWPMMPCPHNSLYNDGRMQEVWLDR